MNWSVIIGIFGTLAGFALSYLAFARNSKKDSTDAGKESGTVLTEIGYMTLSASRKNRTKRL